MLFKGGNIIPGFADYKLNPVIEVIVATQMSINTIQKEHKKLSHFYKSNPDILYQSLNETKEMLYEKKENSFLTDFEQMTLDETNNLLNNQHKLENLFAFQSDYLIDSYTKVFRQIAKKNRNLLKNSETVDLVYYALSEPTENVPIGESYSDGTLNTGSQISLKVLTVNHRYELVNYQILGN